MTKKISISLPDDVAEHLEKNVTNVSAYIAEAILDRRRRERTRDLLRRHGHEVTEQGVAKWRRRLEARQDRDQAELDNAA